jgi:hypothetical protein
MQSGPEYKYRSRERVKWNNPKTGRYELRYGVGAPVPLIEALRQGIVEVGELSEEQKQEIKEHAERDPAAKSALVKALQALKMLRPLNRMVKPDDVVQK